MGIINIGEIIKSERKKRGITQEQLAFDLCTTATLSRIENGLHSPNKELLIDLLDRMEPIDYPIFNSDVPVNSFDFDKESLKHSIMHASDDNDLLEFSHLLHRLEVVDFSTSPLDQQFFKAFQGLYYYQANEASKLIQSELISAIKITFLQFDHCDSYPFLLTYNERILLFLLALTYRNTHFETCEAILLHLHDNYKEYSLCYPQRELFMTRVLKELADLYISRELYDKASIAIDEYIAYCNANFIYNKIPFIKYEKAICALHNQQEAQAREDIFYAYYHLLALGLTKEANELKEKAMTELHINFQVKLQRNQREVIL